MKNIQVIDGAINCSYSIYIVEESDFLLLFPMNGQDVEFIEDVAERLGEGVAGDLVIRATKHRIDKQLACGIHGTLFFDMLHRKSDYPTKRETDLDKPWFNKP